MGSIVTSSLPPRTIAPMLMQLPPNQITQMQAFLASLKTVLASQASTYTSILSVSAPITAPTSFTISQFPLPSFPSTFTFGDGTTH